MAPERITGVGRGWAGDGWVEPVGTVRTVARQPGIHVSLRRRRAGDVACTEICWSPSLPGAIAVTVPPPGAPRGSTDPRPAPDPVVSEHAERADGAGVGPVRWGDLVLQPTVERHLPCLAGLNRGGAHRARPGSGGRRPRSPPPRLPTAERPGPIGARRFRRGRASATGSQWVAPVGVTSPSFSPAAGPFTTGMVKVSTVRTPPKYHRWV